MRVEGDVITLRGVTINTAIPAPTGSYHLWVGGLEGFQIQPYSFPFQFQNNAAERAKTEALVCRQRAVREKLTPLKQQRETLLKKHQAGTLG